MNIKNLSDQLKTVEELQDYCKSQYKLIVDLSKKINQLEEERNHLKQLLDSMVPSLTEDKKGMELYKNVSDEEVICITQLKILRDSSLDRELTVDEAKKVDIYVKILSTIKQRNKNEDDSKIKSLSEEELLALAENK